MRTTDFNRTILMDIGAERGFGIARKTGRNRDERFQGQLMLIGAAQDRDLSAPFILPLLPTV